MKFPLSRSIGALLAAGAVALSVPLAARAQTITTAYTVPADTRGFVFNNVPVAPNNKVIALTFDDGPQPGSTQAILKILADNNIKATFFEIGANIDANPTITTLVKNAGHVLGNHTYNHLQAPPDPTGEITKTDAAFAKLGISTQLFRPPYGNFTNGVIDVALKQGDAGIVWSVDPKDYSMPGTQNIIDTVTKSAAPGAIVLMHDGGGDRSQTVAALPTIIANLRSQGYSFATVPDLLRQRVTATPTPVPTATPTPTPVVAKGDGLSGGYYNITNLNTPAAIRVDKTIDFGWKGATPITGVNGTIFGVSWRGDLRAPVSGQYTMSLSSSGWTRMWLNNQLVVDRSKTGTGTSAIYPFLTGGVRVPIRIDYITDPAAGAINFSWTYPNQGWQVVPQVNLFSNSVTATASAAKIGAKTNAIAPSAGNS